MGAHAMTIDYARMKSVRRQQKSALTRAINSGNPDKITEVCRKAVAEWDAIGAWPDDWSRWQRALSDALPWNCPINLEDLRYYDDA
jgi:hypothetical protein